ncbi:MAG: prenyltransferase, partial [Spirochaetota bacterium]
MTLTQFNRIVEIRTKIISMGTFISGACYALFRDEMWSWSRFAVTGLAVLFVDMGTTGFNSYYDFIRGTDTRELNVERDKVLVHEGVPARIALLISCLLFATAGILGIVLASWTSWYLIPVGAVCMLVGFAYTGGPLPISRTPLGELFAGLFLGTILFLISYYAVALHVDETVIVASLPLLLLIAAILTVNNTCDLTSDQAAGRKTLSILLGPRKAKHVITGFVTGAYLLGIVLSILGTLPRIALPFQLTAAAVALSTLRNMHRRGYSLETKGHSMQAISRIYLLYCLAFILAILADVFLISA